MARVREISDPAIIDEVEALLDRGLDTNDSVPVWVWNSGDRAEMEEFVGDVDPVNTYWLIEADGLLILVDARDEEDVIDTLDELV
jgi:hypothetical protein